MNTFSKWWIRFTGKYLGPDDKVYYSREDYLEHVVSQKNSQLSAKQLIIDDLVKENEQYKKRLNKK